MLIWRAIYDNYMQDPTSQQGFNRYAYCMYNPLKYVDPSGERQMGWVYSTYQWEQEARTAVTKEWERVYDVCTISHNLTHSMACSVYSKGTDACGGGGSSGNHGGGIGGGSVEVKAKGDGIYEMIKGLYDGGNTVYIVDDQGNRTGILGYTLTCCTFYKENGSLNKGVIIDMNDNSGQAFWDDFITNTPSLKVYALDMFDGYINDDYTSIYDFKKHGTDNYRGMLIDFGFGCYISSARDIGNFAAGYLCGIKAVTYRDTRGAFDAFNMITHRKIEGEPPVSRLAQDMGYNWGVHNFYNKLFKRY